MLIAYSVEAVKKNYSVRLKTSFDNAGCGTTYRIKYELPIQENQQKGNPILEK